MALEPSGNPAFVRANLIGDRLWQRVQTHWSPVPAVIQEPTTESSVLEDARAPDPDFRQCAVRPPSCEMGWPEHLLEGHSVVAEDSPGAGTQPPEL